MKKIYTLLLLLAPVLLATSCQDDDTALQTTAAIEQPGPQVTDAEGWSLVNVSGSITGISHNFPEGQIIWTFNEDSTIDVVNNNPDQAAEDFLDTGNYTYGYFPNEIEGTSCTEDLFVWCFVFGCQQIDGNTMTITNQFIDGYTLTFHKN